MMAKLYYWCLEGVTTTGNKRRIAGSWSFLELVRFCMGSVGWWSPQQTRWSSGGTDVVIVFSSALSKCHSAVKCVWWGGGGERDRGRVLYFLFVILFVLFLFLSFYVSFCWFCLPFCSLFFCFFVTIVFFLVFCSSYFHSLVLISFLLISVSAYLPCFSWVFLIGCVHLFVPIFPIRPMFLSLWISIYVYVSIFLYTLTNTQDPKVTVKSLHIFHPPFLLPLQLLPCWTPDANIRVNLISVCRITLPCRRRHWSC